MWFPLWVLEQIPYRYRGLLYTQTHIIVQIHFIDIKLTHIWMCFQEETHYALST